MSRSLTASDRSALIRLASTLPKNSDARRAILARLSPKTAGFLSQDAWFDSDDGGGQLSLEIVVPLNLIIPAGKTWPGGKAVGNLLDKMYEDIENKMLKWSTDFEALGKAQGATLAVVRIREDWTKLAARGSNIVIQSHWSFDTTFGNKKNAFWDPDIIEPMFKTVSKASGFNII